MKAAGRKCGVCRSDALIDFYSVRNVPTNDVVVLDTRDEALRYPRADLRLAACRRCGYIQNRCFQPGLVQYSERCEESQAYSPRFNAFMDELVDRLCGRASLAGKTVVEIGCGKGDFLERLCAQSGARGIGVDPGFQPQRFGGELSGNLRFIQDVIENHPELVASADVVICRHTLEHIAEPVAFLAFLREHVGPGALLFFEVPDAGSMLERVAFWDVYYEHCGYFCAASLLYLFDACGFAVTDIRDAFDGQYLLLEAVSGASGNVAAGSDVDRLIAQCETFKVSAAATLRRWADAFAAGRRAGERTVVWGGGSKAVALLTTLGITDEVDYLVDINPYKQNKFLPGTGHPILEPAAVAARPPDIVILMNPVYENEVRDMLRASGQNPEIRCMR